MYATVDLFSGISYRTSIVLSRITIYFIFIGLHTHWRNAMGKYDVFILSVISQIKIYNWQFLAE